ncbi:MAG: hypothetical protein ACKOWF_03965, partial [Chloroflexota bacterium]
TCGAAGGACAVCGGGETCLSGTCTPCAGCIDSAGVCQPGDLDAECGVSGGSCAACDAGGGETCQSGVCTV